MVGNDDAFDFDAADFMFNIGVNDLKTYITTCENDPDYYSPNIVGLNTLGTKISITPIKGAIMFEVCFGAFNVRNLPEELNLRTMVFNKFPIPNLFCSSGNDKLIISYNSIIDITNEENTKACLNECSSIINEISLYFAKIDSFEKYSKAS